MPKVVTKPVIKVTNKVVLEGTGCVKKPVARVPSVLSAPAPTAAPKSTLKAAAKLIVPPISTPTTLTVSTKPSEVPPQASQQRSQQHIVPAKRAAEPTQAHQAQVKLTKISTVSTTPDTKASLLPRTPTASPSPSRHIKGIESQVAEQRRKLEAIRQKRLENAKRQEELDKKMAEKLERLNREMLEEEAMAADEEEHFNTSLEMLAELEQEGGCD